MDDSLKEPTSEAPEADNQSAANNKKEEANMNDAKQTNSTNGSAPPQGNSEPQGAAGGAAKPTDQSTVNAIPTRQYLDQVSSFVGIEMIFMFGFSDGCADSAAGTRCSR